MKNRKSIIIIIAIIAVVVAGILFFRQSRDADSAWSPELDPNAVALVTDTEEHRREYGFPDIRRSRFRQTRQMLL